MTTDAYDDPPTDQTDTARERAAHALFRRRGYSEDAWTSNHPHTVGIRRDCRYLVDAVIDALDPIP
jgi:hypothetical protein